MIFAFKKLSGKTLSVLSILKIFHVDRNVGLKFNQCIKKIQTQDLPDEVLEIEKQKIFGAFSIVNFLTRKQRSPVQLDRLWRIFGLKKEQQQTFTELEEILSKQRYLEGKEVSEADVVAYIRITRQQVDFNSKQWVEELGNIVNPILTEVASQYKVDPSIKEKIKQKKDGKEAKTQKDTKDTKEPQKQGQQETKQEDQAKKQQQKAPKKQKEVQQITQEYQDKFNSLKVKRINHGQPIDFDPKRKNILITSALPYVNNVPHLGNIIGCVLSADAYARYSRLRGYNTLYVCGTDEYGTATEVKAIQEGMTPQQICDKFHAIHKQCYEWFDIDFDYFGRTSTPIHTEITQDIFNHLHPKFTTLKTKEQTFCESCQRFLSDRYVTGICPSCAFEDARGDQCDSCQKLLDPTDLIEPKCYICKAAPILKDTTHLYINLPTIQPQLEKWLIEAAEKGKWSQNSIGMSKGWLKMGLLERCITRDLTWGVQVPLEELKKKVFYVWFDAPIGYLSITGNFLKDWKQWWMNQDVKLYQFMGKDNVPFHTVIFPSTLLGTGQNYTLLHHISTTEYLNYEDGKFSKSRGVGVFGDNVQQTNIPPEIFRYYLLINRPEKSDSLFTWKDFGDKNNNELLPNLGNLINRTLKFSYEKFDQAVPSDVNVIDRDVDFIKLFLNKFTNEYLVAFENVEIKNALKIANELSATVNKYLQDEKPWEEQNKVSKRTDTVIFVAINAVRIVSAAYEPFIPSVSAKINFLLGFEKRTQEDDIIFEVILRAPDQLAGFLNLVPKGQKLNQPITLFKEFTQQQLDHWKAIYGSQ
ncbi:hypothetical protein pb186bvf_013647 [Paramecium bursaria]